MWLSDLQLVLPDQVITQGALQIVNGRIATIRDEPVTHADIRAPHLIAIPGLIDIHGDVLEREVRPRPRAEMPVDIALHELDKRLVGAGITTHYAAISFTWEAAESLRSEEKALQLIHGIDKLRDRLLCDMYVHSRFEITNPLAGEVLINLLNQRLVNLVSIMDHTPGQGQYRDVEKYVKFIQVWSSQHEGREVTEAEARERVARKQQIPKAWDIVHQVAEIAGRFNIPLASHDDDTAAKVNFVADLGVTISEFPVTAEAAQTAQERGMHVAMGAPNAFRGQSTSGNLSAFDAVADGLVDILATDYHPMSMLQAAWKIAQEGARSLPEAIKLVSTYPAAAVNLTDRGRIEVGQLADLVLFDGRDRPRVHATLRHGTPVYWDRHMAQLTHLSQLQVELMEH